MCGCLASQLKKKHWTTKWQGEYHIGCAGCVVMRAAGEDRIEYRYGPWFQYACLCHIPDKFLLQIPTANCYQCCGMWRKNKTISMCSTLKPADFFANSIIFNIYFSYVKFVFSLCFGLMWFDLFGKNTWRGTDSIKAVILLNLSNLKKKWEKLISLAPCGSFWYRWMM